MTALCAETSALDGSGPDPICVTNAGFGSGSAFGQRAGHSRCPLSKLPVGEREANENAIASRASIRGLAALGQEETLDNRDLH